MKFVALVEGRLEVPVVRKLMSEAGHSLDRLFACTGKDDFMARWTDFVAGPGHRFGLRDLDHDGACVPEWLRISAPRRSNNTILRLAVREVEAWLLADREAFAGYFQCKVSSIEPRPDTLDDPKEHIVQLMRTSSNPDLRTGMTPRLGGGRRVGEHHTQLLGEFARDVWRPRRAERRSESLRRTLSALKNPRRGT